MTIQNLNHNVLKNSVVRSFTRVIPPLAEATTDRESSIGSTTLPLPIYFNALSMADGAYLAYDYAKSKTLRTYRQATPAFLKALKSKVKTSLPRIDLKNSTINGIFADFDNLESILKLLRPCDKNWDDVYNWLSKVFTDDCCIFRSASNKVKIFFPIDSNKESYKSISYLKKRLGSYFSAIDTQGTSLRYSFINENAYTKLQGFLILRTQSNKKILEESKDYTTTSPTPKDKIKWNLYTKKIPNFKLSATEEKVFRFMAGSFYRSTENIGLALPQEFLSEQLSVSQQGVSKAIAGLKKKGLIIKTSSAYRPRGLAARYRFAGKALIWAKEKFESLSPSSAKKEEIIASVKDGSWNESLWALTRYYSSEREYLDAVSSIPGYEDKPERARQAINAWKCHIRIDSSTSIQSRKVA